MRIFAFESHDGKYSNAESVCNAITKLVECGVDTSAMMLFCVDGQALPKDFEKFPSIQVKRIPSEIAGHQTKVKNFIVQTVKDLGIGGFLHVIEEGVFFKKDPTEFINAVEHTMDVLDYNTYFSTVTDGCNYVYSKLNPRLTVENDAPMFEKLKLPSKLSFTSNSNTAWVIYNLDKVEDGILKFDERFQIPMFYIIEYLARRRNLNIEGSLYFMNQYLSIPEELGVFGINITKEFSKEQFANDDAEFKKMNVNYAPDNDVDQVMICLYNKLKSKI